MKNIIIGAGEVGSSLHKVIGGELHDPFKGFNVSGEFDILHVCIPYMDNFVDIVKEYQKKFNVKYTVIHSSVPLGTSDKCNASHSPIRGVHPNIDLGIRTFTKYIGGKDSDIIAEELQRHGIKTKIVQNSMTSEAGKLWDTTYYGWNIVFNKILNKWCKEKGIDFETVYTDFNTSYNEGYLKLGRDEVVRPHLKYMDGKIGGHCVIENCQLLDSEIAEYITNYNNLIL